MKHLFRTIVLSVFCLWSAAEVLAASATIDRIWLEHNVSQDGQTGLRIHLDFTVWDMQGQQGEAVAYFESPKGVGVKDLDRRYYTTDGNVSTSERFTPSYPGTEYSDFTLFIPNEQLHLLPGSHTYYCQVCLFDAQGNVSPKKPDFANKSIYLDQLTYLNAVLEQSISGVLDKDPGAIIIAQSDHGARYPGQMLLYNGGPDYDPELETPYMQNALNCVYLGGKALDIEGLSGINTLRTVMNQEFGTDFPMLEQPTGYTCYGKSWADTPDWLDDLNG